MREPKFHVMSRKNMPVKATGYHKPNTNDIYLDRKRYSQTDKLHEIYHFKKNHPDKPRDVNVFIDHEIEAELYGQRNNRISSTYGLFNGWVDEIYALYKINNGSAIIMIGKRLKRYSVPEQWEKSYRKVVSDVYTAMRKTKRF